MSILSTAKKKASEVVKKAAVGASNAIATASQLSPKQLEDIERRRQAYLKGQTDADTQKSDTIANCLQAISIEITQAYLPQLSQCYLPVSWNAEAEGFVAGNRICYFDITKWVVDTSEKSLDKLTNIYQVLSKEDCTIALIYTRKMSGCTVTLAVENCEESDQPTISESFCDRIQQAFQGNFPGAEFNDRKRGTPPALLALAAEDTVAAVSNLASERSEDFISQSIEKLLDGIVPWSKEEEYSIVLLAQPSTDLNSRRSRLYELYSQLSPYATWQKTQGSNESLSNTASATAGVNVGISSGHQAGANVGVPTPVGMIGGGASVGLNMSAGIRFDRSSTASETFGKSEGATESYTNYGVKHMLELLEGQVKRIEQSTALGMWEFAAYIISPDYETAANVAHMYLSLTQGDDSYMEQAAINIWSARDSDGCSGEYILPWLKALRHPQFGLSAEGTEWLVCPVLTTAATTLSGSELAHALNFPRRSIKGLPVYECVPFGREVVQYTFDAGKPAVPLGHIYHMRREENSSVSLDKDSLTSHIFITGSTGAGKSNAIYTLLDKLCLEDDETKFLVIEPAKGEYKEALGGYPNVWVYGTNPYKMPLLRLNPFSFPEDTHVLEHIDRLIEIFNACWPMYAAMPAVLKAAVEQAYRGCGWSLSSSTCAGKRVFPTFRDVMQALPAVVDSKGFSNDTQGDYKGALLTRLESLTNGINGQVLCAFDELTDAELFDKNVIVDLSRVGSSETKALLMGVLILKLQEHRMAQRAAGENFSNSGLRHITVLEEAHNLLRRTATEQSQESSNLQGKSVEMLTNAIAEMRTYGEGFVIADQAPGLLDMAVIRNTNTKIILRLPDESDRILVGKAAGLNDDQIVELSRLDTGVAAVYQNHWLEPVLCKVSYFDGSKAFAYRPSASIPDHLTESICKALLQESPDGTLLECEGVDKIKTWIDRQKTGQGVKKLLYRALVEQKPVSSEERSYVFYCLAHGKRLVQETRRATVSTDEFRVMADQQIMESLMVSESIAQEIRKIILLYAADGVRSDIQQYHELRELGGVW